MPKAPADYLKEPYTRILIPSTGSYSAEVLEFPGCFSEGATPDEAIRNLEEAAESWIEAALDQGQEIPEPFMNQGFGGKIALRLPRSLHRQAARIAEREGVSLNQFLVSAISTRIGAEDQTTQLLERFERVMSRSVANIAFAIMRLDMSRVVVSQTTGLQIGQRFTYLPVATTPELAGG
jgi:antitoxin HicB